MTFARIDEINVYQRALEVDDATSFADEAVDFAKYGITGAITSGAVGIVNTGIAFANMFGAEKEQYNTYEVMQNSGFDNTAAYYAEHKDAIDTVGFVASSLLPGSLGLKGLKAAQGMAKASTSSSRLAIGVRKALVPESQAKALNTAIKTNQAQNMSRAKFKIDAAKEGFHQAALESVFAETAILLTTNQNPSINGDDLGYLEAVRENLGGFAFGLGFGTGIGGVINTAINYRTLTKMGAGKFIEANELAGATGGADSTYGRIDIAGGDAVVRLLDQRSHIQTQMEKLNTGQLSASQFNFDQLKKSNTELETQIKATIRGMIDTQGAATNTGIADAIAANVLKMDAVDSSDFMANLDKIRAYSDEDSLFDPNITKLNIVAEEDWIDESAKVIYGDNYDPTSEAQRANIKSRVQRVEGFFVNDAAGNRGSILVREKLLADGKTEAALQTIAHEMGHANTDRLSALFRDDVLGIQTELVALSRQHRPSAWASVDQLPLMEKKLLKLQQSGNATIDELQQVSDYIDRLRGFRDYLLDPDELMADAWAQLNDAKHFHSNVRKAPTAYKLMANNAAIKQRVGTSEALLDVKTGDMFAVPERAPTVGDIGNVKYDRHLRQVTYGKGASRGSNKVDLAKFDVRTASPIEASAHYFAAAQEATLATKLPKELEVEWANFAQLNRVMDEHRAGKYTGNVTIKDSEAGTTRVFSLDDTGAKEFREYFAELKTRAITERRNSEQLITPSQLARLMDTSEEFALSNGRTGGTKFWSEAYDVNEPTVARLVYKTRKEASDPIHQEGIANANMRIRTAQENTKAAVVGFFSKIDKTVPDMMPPAAWETGQNIAKDATPLTEGSGFVSALQAEYGSIESFAQAVAEGNSKAKGEWHRVINDALAPSVLKVSNNPVALAEASVLDSVLRRDKYTFAPQVESVQELKDYLLKLSGVTADDLEGLDRVAKNIATLESRGSLLTLTNNMGNGTIWGGRLTDALYTVVNSKRLTTQQMENLGTSLEKSVHQIKSPDVISMWKAKVRLNETIVEGKRTVASVRGISTNLDDGVLYPGPHNTKLYKYMKFVYPKKGGMFDDGKPSIIASNTPEGLAQKQAQVEAAFGQDVLVKSVDEIEADFVQKGQFDSQLAMRDYHVDTTMMNKGILSDAVPEPNPELLQQYVRHMNLEASSVIDNLTAANYGEEFAQLETYGNMQRANMAGIGKGIAKNDVALDEKIINIMLNRETRGKYEAWRTAQESVDKIASKAFSHVSNVFRAAESTVDYQEMDALMKSYGMPSPYTNRVGSFLRTTHNIPETTLKEVVPRVNAFASNWMLRLDAAQWMVSAMSLPITSVPEMKHLIDALPKLRGQQVRESLEAVVPDGSGNKMPSNFKLLQQATKDFFNDKELVKHYEDLGLMPSIVREMREGIDDVAINPVLLSKAGELSKWKAQFEKVKEVAFAPSNFSESFVKFVAARSADLALTAGGVTDPAVRNMAMLSYVKRVHANYTYAQRPAMFQGFAGQAIGLFQTYQFNLFQQLLRHIGDKNVGATSSMLGLQAGIFGTQSVPGFQLMNNYIGEKSTEGNDFYTGTKEIFGNEVSEWMLYGVSSNFTKPVFGSGIALYTRGDLTPRTPILIPTSVSEVPAISITNKFISNISNAARSLGNGVPVDQVFMEALSHNGINRPLAGLGQLLSGGYTTSKGTLLAATHDLDAWESATRLIGSKPLDESIAVQAFYRTKAYDSHRREKLTQLGQSAKQLIRGGTFDSDTYNTFLSNYAAQGGRQEYFHRWLNDQAIGATDSAIMDIYKANESPSGRYMQNILGGDIEQYIDVTYD